MATSAENSKVGVIVEVSLQTLLQLIPDFDTNDVSQVYRYIRSCESAFNLAHISQQEILLVYALNKIIGPSASDVHSKQYNSWADLKTFLIQKFSQTKTLAHLNLELQAMFQKSDENITEYFHRVDLCRNKIIEKLSAEIKDSSLHGRRVTAEETALNVFINGINSEIGLMLLTKEFTNLSDAGNFAMQMEKMRKMNNDRKLYLGLKQNPKPIFKPPFTPRPNASLVQQSTQKLCNYCKNPGHLIHECRKRAYNNSIKTQSQRALPAPPRRINHLNSQAAVSTGTPTETASAHYSAAQTPTSNQTNQMSIQELTSSLDNIQF